MNTPSSGPTVRINRFLAMCGLGSRRECEKLVLAGKIQLNGRTLKQLGTAVEIEKDEVLLDGKRINPKKEEIFLIFNKPPKTLVSRKGFGRPTIFDFLKGLPRNLSCAGRLDWDSEGLLLLSTQGELIERLIHPRYKVTKIYLVMVAKPLTYPALLHFRRGILLEDGKTNPAQIEKVRTNPLTYRVILSEGRNRQIRRMLAHLGHRVLGLKRVAMGPLKLGNLKLGQYRTLTKNEKQKLELKLKLKKLFFQPK